MMTGETGKAVLVSLDDWNASQENLYLMSIPRMRESILEGGKIPLSDCVSQEELEW